ncbi:MAG: DegV family protein [Oscillospiraceae bacterium]|nr:DegV family protein [Oscillospiraceae bacterium]
MAKICITTDCVCDLPDAMLKKYDIDLVYFYIETDTGRFKDVDEITADNVFDYFRSGGSRIFTEAPPADELAAFFTEKLSKYDEVIHISISEKISNSVGNARSAKEKLGELGKRVHIVDSGHLSTGIGHMVLRAAEMVQNGAAVEKIVSEAEAMRMKISTSFMAYNADYLYRNDKVSKTVHQICTVFNIHPVLGMKDGYLKLKSFHIGKYEKCAVRYVRKELKNHERINKKRLFITHAGGTVSDIKLARSEVSRIAKFDEVIVTKASATISGNSGPRTFGLLYIEE